MKKLILLTVLAVIATCASAQITFTLVSNPCDTNKVLAINFTTAAPPPYVVEWQGYGTYSGSFYLYDTVTSLTDTLFHYDGAAMTVYVLSGGSYVGAASFPAVTPAFTFTFAPTPAFCGATATASVTVTGGTPPYNYYWYNIYSFPTTAASTNPALLPSGTFGITIFGITIIDASGCIASTKMSTAFSSSTTTVGYDTLIPTTTFAVTTVTTDANCTNGAATVTSLPGSAMPPLSYLWSTGATSPSIAGLVAGTYPVTVTDALGCVAHGSAHINQLTTITVHTTPTPATCLAGDGAIIGFGSGGTPPYTYLWSNGATTQSQSGLTAGPLNLTVTDANGCTGTGNGTVTASTPITVTYTATPSLCTSPTGTATITIAGGTPPYSNIFYTSPVQTGTVASNLAPGTYSFHVVDAMGCIQNGAVVVPPIDNFTLNFTPTPALCTLSNGSINLSISGGVSPYTYLWSTGATTANISGQPAGNYNVTVTDANGCAKTKTTNLPFTSPVTVGVSSTPASCLFISDGAATAVGIGGTAPYTYKRSNGGTTSTISSLITSYLDPGQYWVTVTDASGCVSYGNYDYVGYNALDSTCFCIIKGTVFYDMNGNCIQDAGEPGIPNIQVFCTGYGYTYTNALGEYYFIVPGGTYTIKQTVLSYYPLSACQSNNIVVSTSPGIGCTHIVNFADSINPIHDVSLCTWDYNHPVPGTTYMQTCIISNHGTITEPNILGEYYTDGQVFGASFLPSGIFLAAGANSYSTYGGSSLSLAPGATIQFYMNYSVPTFIPVGTPLVFRDSVAYTSPITNWLTDYSPWNNVNYFTTPVLASYDPNFIEVNPKGAGLNGVITNVDSNLQYMVHFQNTGTYQAQNIVVIDTLDPNLDWTTLQPVYESAPCSITLRTNGVVTFTFSDINLSPAATSPVTSNGMFTYTIRTRSGLPMGTKFKAHASIYFDYNAPVMTDTTLNTLDSIVPAGVNDISSEKYNSFTIYPNPANQTFNSIINADDAGKATMIVADITGKVLITKPLTLQKGSQTITTDASQLSAGIYFVTFNHEGKPQTQKLVIMK